MSSLRGSAAVVIPLSLQERLIKMAVELHDHTAKLSYHPDFCYEDGSIILLVEETTAFKVHKSILCQHSSVFRDMLSLPLKTSGNDLAVVASVTGGESEPVTPIPVVSLAQDEVPAIAGVLKAIYDNRFFDKYLPNLMTEQDEETYLRLLSTMMPIARKYDFESVLGGCIEALRRVAPVMLPDLMKRLETLQNFVAEPEKRTSIILMTLKLADMFDLTEFFPALFYQIIAFHTPEDIYNLPGLSWKDKARCAMGIAELRMEQEDALRCHFPPSGDCTKLVRTEEGWIRPLCNKRPSLSAKLKRSKRVFVFERLEFEKESNVVHCRDCTSRYATEYERNQMRIWSSLPKIFHLSKSWEDLLQGRLE
ncbi:hypothetical protein EST38_g13389 [Candolleomyces aberdarensis]|uniref:BTB domain-containing protein n=1 Tax=Candolleomyces aberdarensis TaxID=2316362 RepID=A0A4Q2D2S6_9AGAR|nr:hypothetical protein EST38_g13389 [Candolleomyces aberdarensis]